MCGASKYYKVVTDNLKSLGLRNNPNIMTFPVGAWVNEPNPIVSNTDIGGIWVANGLSQAKALTRYMDKKNISCKMFEVKIGKILYENTYRVKTNKVKLIKEIRDE